MTIGNRIKNRRIELNLSQDELAKKVGYKSRSSINKLELKRSIPLSKVEIMAKALECTPAYLMGWTDETKGMPDRKVPAAIKVSAPPTTEKTISKRERYLLNQYNNADEKTKNAVDVLLDMSRFEKENISAS